MKRDRVNRITGYVYLPIDGSRLIKGQVVTLNYVEEASIDCAFRDPMAMESPKNGDFIGDAIFDATDSGMDVNNACDAIFEKTIRVHTVLGNPIKRTMLGCARVGGRYKVLGETTEYT